MDTVWQVGTIVLSIGLSGSVTYYFVSRQFKRDNRFNKIKDQFSNFYSPMISCLKEIRARAEIRKKIEDANEKYYSTERSLEEHQFYKKSIEYENEKFRNEILPLYEKMLNVFKEKFHLAEKSTQIWYEELSQYIDVWKRYLDKTLRYETIKELDIKEEKLKPFYDDLEHKFDKLQNKM